MLLALALGGRAADRVRAAGAGRRSSARSACVMIATAVAIATDADVRFQTALADHFPAALVNPTGSTRALARGLDAAREAARRRRASPQPPSGDAGTTLPVLGEAPDFTGNERWFNTPASR